MIIIYICIFSSHILGGRNAQCVVCGDSPSITRHTFEQHGMDYEFFCSAPMHDRTTIALNPNVPSISVQQLADHINTLSLSSSSSSSLSLSSSSSSSFSSSSSSSTVLLDVREPHQFAICALHTAVNVPLRHLLKDIPDWLKTLLSPKHYHNDNDNNNDNNNNTNHASSVHPQSMTLNPCIHPPSIIPSISSSHDHPVHISVICRRGIDSMTATKYLTEWMEKRWNQQQVTSTISSSSSSTSNIHSKPIIRNVTGGLQQWSKMVDKQFPVY